MITTLTNDITEAVLDFFSRPLAQLHPELFLRPRQCFGQLLWQKRKSWTTSTLSGFTTFCCWSIVALRKVMPDHLTSNWTNVTLGYFIKTSYKKTFWLNMILNIFTYFKTQLRIYMCRYIIDIIFIQINSRICPKTKNTL